MKRFNLLKPTNWQNVSHIKVVNGCFEMHVPVKNKVLQKLPDIYNSALKRTWSLRRNALCDLTFKQTLLNTFAELVAEEWIVPAGLSDCDTKCPSGTYHFLLPSLTNQELCTTVQLRLMAYHSTKLFWQRKVC